MQFHSRPEVPRCPLPSTTYGLRIPEPSRCSAVLLVVLSLILLGHKPPRAEAQYADYPYFIDYYADFDYGAYVDDWYAEYEYSNVHYVEEASPVPVLQAVQERGHVILGTYTDVPARNGTEWSGFEVDLGRAVAAAVLGNASDIELSPVLSSNRWIILTQGTVDVLAAVSSWTSERDAQIGISFAGPYFHDFQDILVRKDHNISSIEDLQGKTIALKIGTTSAVSATDEFQFRGLEVSDYWVSTHTEMFDVLLDGTVDAITADCATLQTGLCAIPDGKQQFKLLGARLGREPLSLVVGSGDQQWADIVRWVLRGMISAEDQGISSSNVDKLLGKCSYYPSMCALLGSGGDTGLPLGLDPQWLYRVIKQVGNYGEVFDRHLGRQSTCCLDRGLNVPWSKGGILFSPLITLDDL